MDHTRLITTGSGSHISCDGDKCLENQGKAALMVGIAIPEKLMEKLAMQDKYPVMQGHKHQWSVIRSIESGLKDKIDLVSFACVGDYPRHPAIILKGGRWAHRERAKDIWVPYVNLLGLKHLTRLVGIFCGTLIWLVRNMGQEERYVFVYTSISAALWGALLATVVVPARTLCILADPPSKDLPGEGNIYRMARKVDRWLQKKGLKRMSAIIGLTERLPVDLAPGVDYIVMEGILSQENEGVKSETSPYRKTSESGKFILMYAGALTEAQGVDVLLRSMAFLDPSIELWLAGRGPLESMVKQLASKDGRIRYLGLFTTAKMFELEHSASLLICARPSKAWDTKYLFPSKLLEYMSTGVPVLCTRIEEIPKEYEPFLFWIDRETPEGFAVAIEKIRGLPIEELEKFGREARKFIIENKNEHVQGKRICQLMERIRVDKPRDSKADVT